MDRKERYAGLFEGDIVDMCDKEFPLLLMGAWTKGQNCTEKVLPPALPEMFNNKNI